VAGPHVPARRDFLWTPGTFALLLPARVSLRGGASAYGFLTAAMGGLLHPG